MKSFNKIKLILLLLFIATKSFSGSLVIPNQFSANTPAVAAEVNENFDEIASVVNTNDAQQENIALTVLQLQTQMAIANNNISTLQSDLADANVTITGMQASAAIADSHISALQSDLADAIVTITSLQTNLAILESNTVLSLNGYLQLTTFDGSDTAEFTGVNVQINNGTGSVVSSNGPFNNNGLGNLIVGYNEFEPSATEFCSDNQYDNQVDCEASAETWGNNMHTGSHNIVVGRGNSFTSQGGVVFGSHNAIVENFANVTGGRENIASGLNSAVSGGDTNTASGKESSVSGGVRNIAGGENSSISGGDTNLIHSNARSSSISGGLSNETSQLHASVSGGRDNVASGIYSSISGGNSRTTVGIYDWVAGSLFEDD